jgi:hypothetical protein
MMLKKYKLKIIIRFKIIIFILECTNDDTNDD